MERQRRRAGEIGWIDLTVPDAVKLRDFYRSVVGWETSAVDMGGYQDFNVMPRSGEPVAGICHARGTNAGLPPQWLIYVIVEDLDASLAQCRQRGGEIIAGPKGIGSHDRYCVIRDPAGAVCGLYQQA